MKTQFASMFLFMDTAQKEKMTLALCRQGGDCADMVQIAMRRNHSEALLPAIAELIRKNRVRTSELKGILVHRGPGSFTGVRVGVAVANALGFALNIPVVGVKKRYGLGPPQINSAMSRRKEFARPVTPRY